MDQQLGKIEQENIDMRSSSIAQISSLESSITDKDEKIGKLNSGLNLREIQILQQCLDTAHGHILEAKNKVNNTEELCRLKTALTCMDHLLEKNRRENVEIKSTL